MNGSRGTPLGSPGLAAALAVVAVVLVAAIVVVPGLLPSPSGSPGASPTGASAMPSGGTASPGTSVPGPSPTFVRPTPTPLPTFTSYVIRPGDTLTSIARAFDTSARSLAWWNRGTYPSLDPESEGYDPGHIEVGWVLVLIPGTVVDDANPPTPSPGLPTPSPTVGPSTSPTPTPPQGEAAVVVSHGARGTNQVALTFDMGGRLDPAVEIVQWLIDHDVKATLFPTGKSATTTTEGRAAMVLAATRPDLFDLGNHSWDHPDFTTLDAGDIEAQLTSAEVALVDLLGWTTKPWFRPPYGAWDADVRAWVGAAGWSRVVMWDIDTIDWRPTADGGPTAADIVTKVVSRAEGGSIVLMHLGGWNTLDALPGILDGLTDRGLVPVTLGEMSGL